MPLPRVVLNGVTYIIKGKVQRYSQRPFGDVFRTIGLQRREGLQGITSFVFPSPIYGFGRRRITKIDDPKQLLQMWDSQVMTHFESQVGLAPLRVADTGEESGVIRGSAVFKGSLWGLWFSGVATPTFNIYARELTSATDTAWGGGGAVDNVASTLEQDAVDLTVHKDRLVALWLFDNGTNSFNFGLAFSTVGVTWTQATTLPGIGHRAVDAGAPGDDGNADAGKLVTVGNELVAVVYEKDAGTITFLSSTDSGVTMVDELTNIPSNNGVTAALEYIGIDGLRKLLVMSETGVWEVDTAPATWTATLIIPIRYHVDNGRRATIHQGAVWIPTGTNSGEPAGMIRYTVNGDTRLIETNVGVNGEALGLDAFDGVPSDKLGPFNWLKSTGKYLLAAVGGTAASRNGHLLIHNGLGWHYLARNATANQRLYWVDDINGTPHYANRTATGDTTSTTDTLGVQNALVNPASGLAIARESSGILDHPELDGGMPRYNAAWLEVFVDAINLGSVSGEYDAIAYGLNGAAASTTSLGNIVDGDLDLLFGTGGVGVSARSIQIRETFNRDAGTNTDTPTWRSLELTYRKKPATLEAWAFTVDLVETAKITSGGTVATVITNLETARDSVVLVPFIYGRMTSANVIVEEPLRFDETLDESAAFINAVTEGLVTVLVRKLV